MSASVEELIEAQARRTPTHVAVQDERRRLTYAELQADVDRLARHLRALGVVPERRVGLLLDRSVDALVALLAVLRAGGAYVPLDPAYPSERLAYVVRDASVSLIVTDNPDAARAISADCRIVNLVNLREEPSLDTLDAFRPGARPHNLASVMYTSGTSGKPKGVAIERRTIALYTCGVIHALNLPTGGYAVVSTFATDLGQTTIFPALCTGSTLHVISKARATDPEAWCDYATRHAIDCLKIVPSHLRLLLQTDRPAQALPRQRLILGGEAADLELLTRVRTLAPDCQIFNHYGPTETTVGVIAGTLIPWIDASPPGIPPLGWPLPNTRIYVVDSTRREVAHADAEGAGAEGELAIGGRTLARGYLGQPGLTAERFVPDPFSDEPGARMYCTGDRSRQRSDGRFEFLGRIDDQVKIGGFRVEPGEVSATLAAHPGVAATRVLARHDGVTRLVAYVVPAVPDLTDADLRAFLRTRLPAHLVPSAFVLLDRMPITPSGKLDLATLASITPQAANVGTTNVESTSAASTNAESANVESTRQPATIEDQLRDVWRQLLGHDSFDAHDDFFDVGGTSFLAVQLRARIERRFDRLLPLARIVTAASIEGLSRLLAAAEPAEPAAADPHARAADDPLVAIRAQGRHVPLFCVHPGQGTVFCYKELARHLDADQPIFGLQAFTDPVDHTGSPTIEAMARRHVEAITTAHPHGPYVLAGWSFGGLLAFEMAQQLRRAGRDVARLLLFDCRFPLTAAALAQLNPALFRLSMLFPGRYLMNDGQCVITGDAIADLDLQQQLALLSTRLGRPIDELLPNHVEHDHLEDYLDMRMARVRAMLAYRPSRYAGPITLFRSSEVDLDTPFPELRQALERAAVTHDYGWSDVTETAIDVRVVPGTHESIFSEPHIRGLARELTACLRASRQHDGQPAK
jgi:amino acid adenylation domain-containing protein